MGTAKQFKLRKCKKCGIDIRRAWRKKGFFYCYKCYKKQLEEMPFNMLNRRPNFTLKQALEREYTIRACVNKQMAIHCTISVPSALAGKKVKLVLVEDEEE